MTKKSPSTNDHHRYLKISVTDHVDPSDPDSTYINLSDDLRPLFNGPKQESFDSVEAAQKTWDQLTTLMPPIMDKVQHHLFCACFPVAEGHTKPEGCRECTITCHNLYGEQKQTVFFNKDIKLSPKMTLRANDITELLLSSQSHGLSYNNSADIIKQASHGRVKLAASTCHDVVDKIGWTMSNATEERRAEIFEANGFTEQGKPKDVERTKQDLKISEQHHLQYSKLASNVVRPFNDKLKQEWEQLPEEIRQKRPPLQVKSLAFSNTFEANPAHCVYIRIDEVGVPKQKSTRDRTKPKAKSERKLTPKAKRKQTLFAKEKREQRQKRRLQFTKRCTPSYAETRPRVQTTSITVDWNSGRSRHCLVGTSVDDGMKTLVAFLLENKLLGKPLVFFIDGAQCLSNKIKEYFGYCSPQITMDWYHAARYLSDLVHCGAGGSSADRDNAVTTIRRLLWFYDLAGAKRFIKELKKGKDASTTHLERALGYIERKQPTLTCYALRHEFGMPNSSSLVEKYNDLLVASRQKNSAASWTEIGSHIQALISCAYINKAFAGDETPLCANAEHFDLFKCS